MRVALEQGMKAVVEQIQALRVELGRDVDRLENVLEDHESRIRRLERHDDTP